jgi:hypothetical protein
MTIDEAKERLPSVQVRCAANMVVLCKVSGRRNPYATVTIPCAPGGRLDQHEFSWKAVALAATHGIPLAV